MPNLVGSEMCIRNRYFRFQPVDDIFGCELNDSREVTRVALRDAAARYMSTETVDAEVEELAKALAHDG